MTNEMNDLLQAVAAEWGQGSQEHNIARDVCELANKEIEDLTAENERLLQIAQRLGTYSAHDDDCRIMTHGVWSDPIPCTCGYTDAWQALAALEKQP